MIATCLLAASGILLSIQYATMILYLRRLRKPYPCPAHLGLPRITLLRPICGVDSFDAETLATSFAQDYPDYEIIFCAPSEQDASVALVKKLMVQHPRVQSHVLFGIAPVTGNPKLNNLAKGWAAATAEWICMADSNLLLPENYLRCLVAAWGESTGLVTSPAIGTRPGNFAASLECAFLNSNQARWQFTADSLGMGFAQGKTLFWNRRFLDEAGGIKVLGGRLAEDVAATLIVRKAEKKVSLTNLPFAQPLGRRRVRQVWERQLRWSRVRRDGFSSLFFGEVFNGSALAILLFALGVHEAGFATLYILVFAALWYGAEVVLMWRAQWPCGWKDIVALATRDLLLPALWLVTFRKRGIEWRGNQMEAPAAAGNVRHFGISR